jgi:NAD(P)-dependent dehydrogenase (short-subunit alcohol dehydrogenase family)
MMDFDLRKKHALITGAGGNLGGAIATELAMQGVSVALMYGSFQSKERTKRLAERLSCFDDVDAFAIHCDITDAKGVHDAIQACIERFSSIDILVNNAGIFTSSSQEDLAETDWDAVMDINVKGLWRTVRECSQALKQSRGVVVNVCSINAFRPGFGNTAHYDASKGAIAAYTRSLAAEYAPYGVRVNAVAPGLLDSRSLREHAPDLVGLYTQRAALRRLVSPQEIASIICFLASGASSAMTGEIVAADCGYAMM